MLMRAFGVELGEGEGRQPRSAMQCNRQCLVRDWSMLGAIGPSCDVRRSCVAQDVLRRHAPWDMHHHGNAEVSQECAAILWPENVDKSKLSA